MMLNPDQKRAVAKLAEAFEEIAKNWNDKLGDVLGNARLLPNRCLDEAKHEAKCIADPDFPATAGAKAPKWDANKVVLFPFDNVNLFESIGEMAAKLTAEEALMLDCLIQFHGLKVVHLVHAGADVNDLFRQEAEHRYGKGGGK